MAIPKTFIDGNPEDRATLDDFWSWLKEQPKDVWHLWARNANWDNADGIFADMVADPDCDLATVAYLFWASEPGFYAENPAQYQPGELIHTIVENAHRGFYRRAELYLNRYEVLDNAQSYALALAKMGDGAAPFLLPRALCGPFNGRRAQIARPYDAQTERDLEDIFQSIDGWLPRSEGKHWTAQVEGGNVAIKEAFPLPAVPQQPQTALAALSDRSYVEAIFGNPAAYAAARAGLHAQGRGDDTGPSFKTAAKWLGIFFVAAMTIAIVMRRINFGVWM